MALLGRIAGLASPGRRPDRRFELLLIIGPFLTLLLPSKSSSSTFLSVPPNSSGEITSACDAIDTATCAKVSTPSYIGLLPWHVGKVNTNIRTPPTRRARQCAKDKVARTRSGPGPEHGDIWEQVTYISGWHVEYSSAQESSLEKQLPVGFLGTLASVCSAVAPGAPTQASRLPVPLGVKPSLGRHEVRWWSVV